MATASTRSLSAPGGLQPHSLFLFSLSLPFLRLLVFLFCLASLIGGVSFFSFLHFLFRLIFFLLCVTFLLFFSSFHSLCHFFVHWYFSSCLVSLTDVYPFTFLHFLFHLISFPLCVTFCFLLFTLSALSSFINLSFLVVYLSLVVHLFTFLYFIFHLFVSSLSYFHLLFSSLFLSLPFLRSLVFLVLSCIFHWYHSFSLSLIFYFI